MKELKQFRDNIEKIITDFKGDSAFNQKLSSALSNKNYKSKLDYGLEYGCEELISKVYPVWVLDKEVSFFTDVLSEILIGLTSEKLQAEAAVIISEKVSSTVRNFMWWGMYGRVS